MISNYIKQYSNLLPQPTVDMLIKYIQSTQFQEANVVDERGQGVTDYRQRKTNLLNLHNLGGNGNYTKAKWYNVLKYIGHTMLDKYRDDVGAKGIIYKHITQIDILKYGVDDHFVEHHDHCFEIPRSLSISFILNDNYEGGDLQFIDPATRQTITIKKEKNSMIIFPSSFMYAHKVTPVTKGERYSVIIWAL
jgi:hypothetical protein